MCLDEALTRTFGANTSLRALSTTRDGGIVAGLFRNNQTNSLESFVARLDDAGVTLVPLALPPSVQLLAVAGTRDALYVGGRDRVADGGSLGTAVLYRLRR